MNLCPLTATRRVAAILAVSAALAACGSSSDDAAGTSQPAETTTAASPTSTAPGSTAAQGDAGTIDVESPFGTVTVPADPQAALGMYPTDIDVLVTLGFPLASTQPVRDVETGFPAYLDAVDLDDIETFTNWPEFNYEGVLAAHPDFILNSLGYEEETVDKLPQIAPTYSYNGFDGTPWLPRFEELATKLHRVEQYEAWTATYDAKVAELRAALGDRPAGITVAPLSYYNGMVTASCGGSYAICGVLEDLGFRVFEPATLLSGELGVSPGTDYSLENLDQLAEIDAVVTTFTAEATTTLDELTDNAVWQRLGFVSDDQIFGYDREAAFGSPSAALYLLDQVAAAFAG